MSHFTVTVRLTAERLARHDEDYEDALAEIMAPYNESLETDFEDQEDEYRAEYDNESVEMVRCPDGVLRRTWDEYFCTLGAGLFGGPSRPEVPPECERVQIPHKERYATLEEFAADWHGNKSRDEKHGRFGYWKNAQAKWDWFQIGGRWRGYYPVKPHVMPIVGESGAFDNEPDEGGSDVVFVEEIDMDVVATKGSEAFEKFKAERTWLMLGEKFPAFEGPRSRMLDMGLLRIEEDPNVLLGEHEVQVGRMWGFEHAHLAGTDRAAWRDVAVVLTDEELERYRVAFNPLRTYAALDDSGWHEGDGTADSYLAFADAFQEKFIKAAGPNDLLVVVDCHI